MTLLLISDLHSQKETLKDLSRIVLKHHPDGLICAGDITQRGDIDFLNRFFEIIKHNNLPAFMIWGNSDIKKVQEDILRSPYNIHLIKRKIRKWPITGLSNSDEAVKIEPPQIKGSIFVTHQPPLTNLLNQKFKNAPLYHISGHLHFSRWVKRYPSTTHIQIPALINRGYALFNPNLQKIRFF